MLLSVLAACSLLAAGDPDILPASAKDESPKIQWESLTRQSLLFLSIEHAFRLTTEPGTRDGFRGSYFRGYLGAVRNMHGWADGDPFYVNFIGHPLHGAVSGNIFVQNDPAYRDVSFGRDRRYWLAKLRAGAFSFLYSTQFEIGPLSEASIGKVQSVYPQVGFVDHVVTPVIGTGWMIAEDAIDKYLIRRFEDRFTNPVARLLVRGGLNPSRSLANVLRWRPPWYRDTRSGVLTYGLVPHAMDLPKPLPEPFVPSRTPRFEFALPAHVLEFGRVRCLGGAGEAAYRVKPSLDMMLTVGGCKMIGLEENLSGDSLFFLAGPRWTPRPLGRFTPRTHILFGGHKITTERVLPEVRTALIESSQKLDFKLLRPQYTESKLTDGFAMAVGLQMDIGLNRVLNFRLASVEYLRTWLPAQQWGDYQTGFRVSTGLVLKVGTW